ncbi:hypothetical protein IQ260_11025 [Leptolyngbya cf. ectocarpi LEGE 11479]|uniref:Uncharacterized protein n=1 Tax=Leptolyngbya cf. ectocarpi LEGE 11479 TaxID=1828722 RepID=A0A928X4P6_LEPEC|nr:hypothetical protein [Leptolyngbya ectocarpi]MBE9067188.1 hypothetical protein [Leptolyngbya cf. ectocarpi LEGE 11479]
MMTTVSDAHAYTIDLIFEAVGIMVPVITGYLVVFVGGVGTLWEISTKRLVKINWRLVGVTLLLGLLSLGTFAGAMHFGLSATLDASEAETKLLDARWCLAIGYNIFVGSLIAGAYTCFRAVRPRRSS